MYDMVCLQGGLGEEGPMGKSGRNGNKVIPSSSFFQFLFVEYLPFWWSVLNGIFFEKYFTILRKKAYFESIIKLCLRLLSFK